MRIEVRGEVMTVPIRAFVRSGVVIFAGLGAGAAFLILGVAGVALRNQCAPGATSAACVEQPMDPVVTGSTEPEFDAETVVAMRQPAAEFDPRPVSATAAKLERADGMIAATFALLVSPDPVPALPDPEPTQQNVTAVAAVTGIPDQVDVPADVAVSADDDVSSTAVAKRVVRSVKINAEGDPIWPVSAYAQSAASVAAASPAEAAIESEVPAAESTLVADVEPLALSVSDTPPAHEPDATAAPKLNVATVIGGPTNVRAGPSREHEKLFVLKEGAEVEALAVSNGWVRVVFKGDRAGWIWAEYLGGLDASALPEPSPEMVAEIPEPQAAPKPAAQPETKAPAQVASADTRTVKGQGVNVRSGPSSSSGKLFALVGGTEVTVLDNEKGWLKVTDPKGRTGWAYKDYIN